ncbi:TRAP transporter permease [Chloroflexota bacterium]
MGRKIITGILIMLALFQLGTALTIPLPNLMQRSVHLAFVLTIIFLTTTHRRPGRGFGLLDALLAVAAVGTCVYVALNWLAILERSGQPFGIEPWLGFILVLLILEATRRTTGPALPVLAILSLLYALFGHDLGQWAFPQIPLQDVFAYQYTTPAGIWGAPVAISATMVAAFVMLGAFLTVSGVERVFTMLAFGLAGKLAGGPALVSVTSSGFIGMITGSGVANVLTTGAYTIPLMKRSGYSPAFAGGVEAAASTGGQIMPPIMGAAAFLMAEFLDMSYWSIVVAAAVPGILYFVTMAIGVHAEAAKMGLGKMPADVEVPSLRYTLVHYGYQLLPVVLLVVLIGIGWGPAKAAAYGVVMVILLSWVRKDTRMGPKKFLQALQLGARNLVTVASAGACAGVILGSVAMTGLGAKFSILMVGLSAGHLMLTLVMAMFAAIILGMSLPVVACYAVAASALAMGLVMVGLPPLVAHFFIMYFAVFSGLTPPVCITAYAAAGIAEANWLRTAGNACKLGIPMFILGYMFVYNHALLAIGSPLEILREGVTALIGLAMVARGFSGYIIHKANLVERLMFLAGGIILAAPVSWQSLTIGCGLGVIVLVKQLWTGRRSKKQ